MHTGVFLFAVAQTGSAQVLKVVLNDTINPITDEFLGRALTQAKETKAQAVLIEINTPGGLLDSTRDIIEKILRLACAGDHLRHAQRQPRRFGRILHPGSADIAAMAPGTNTGAAHPVSLGGGKMDDIMKEKIENDLAAFMRSFVSKRGRNVEVAESAVRESKSFTDRRRLPRTSSTTSPPASRNSSSKSRASR